MNPTLRSFMVTLQQLTRRENKSMAWAERIVFNKRLDKWDAE